MPVVFFFAPALGGASCAGDASNSMFDLVNWKYVVSPLNPKDLKWERMVYLCCFEGGPVDTGFLDAVVIVVDAVNVVPIVVVRGLEVYLHVVVVCYCRVLNC